MKEIFEGLLSWLKTHKVSRPLTLSVISSIVLLSLLCCYIYLNRKTSDIFYHSSPLWILSLAAATALISLIYQAATTIINATERQFASRRWRRYLRKINKKQKYLIYIMLQDDCLMADFTLLFEKEPNFVKDMRLLKQNKIVKYAGVGGGCYRLPNEVAAYLDDNPMLLEEVKIEINNSKR